jgi:hypothetical protein
MHQAGNIQGRVVDDWIVGLVGYDDIYGLAGDNFVL